MKFLRNAMQTEKKKQKTDYGRLNANNMEITQIIVSENNVIKLDVNNKN